LAAGSLVLLLLFVFGLMPQRFLLDLDFAESGFAYPVVLPPLPLPTAATPPPLTVKPIARGPSERFWAEYLAVVEAGDLEAALQLLEEHLARNPNDLDAALEYARALWRAGRLDEAIDAYRVALARGASLAVSRELVSLLVTLQRWDEAILLYEDMMSESPGDAALLREYARALVWAGRYEEALEIFAQLAALNPDDEEVLREYAAVANWAGRYDLALPLYERLVHLAPDDAQLRLEWARTLLWALQPNAAAEAVAGLPADFSSPGLDSLRVAIEQAMLVVPESGETLLDQARASAWIAEPDSVLALYRRFLSENPQADSVLLEMADIFEYRAEARDSAVAYLNSYLIRHPGAEAVELRLARLLAWSGRYHEAETIVRGILAGNPENAEAWVLLGDLYRWQGERKPSATAYKRALEIDPWVVGAADGLAALDAQLDDQLAARGTIGGTGGLETFADNDDFSRFRLRGGWTGGSPRIRAGVEMGVERLRGLDQNGARTEAFAFDVEASAESWFSDGDVNARVSAGAWVPDGGGSAQPTLGVSVEAPDWRGAAYRFEYLHAPGYREAATLGAEQAGLRMDALSAETYRPLTGHWDLAAQGRASVFSGLGDGNLRLDAGLGLFYKLDDKWTLGYQTRGLTFSDSAPNLGRRLYWDPEWSWSNFAVVSWRSEVSSRWQVGAWFSPGIAILQERGSDPTVVPEFTATADMLRQFGDWALQGRAALGQSRADGYRSFAFELSLSRGFGQ
jgi:tetratricopeptide (TPR) repeat protein